jgi:hypothetical protein
MVCILPTVVDHITQAMGHIMDAASTYRVSEFSVQIAHIEMNRQHYGQEYVDVFLRKDEEGFGYRISGTYFGREKELTLQCMNSETAAATLKPLIVYARDLPEVLERGFAREFSNYLGRVRTQVARRKLESFLRNP